MCINLFVIKSCHINFLANVFWRHDFNRPELLLFLTVSQCNWDGTQVPFLFYFECLVLWIVWWNCFMLLWNTMCALYEHVSGGGGLAVLAVDKAAPAARRLPQLTNVWEIHVWVSATDDLIAAQHHVWSERGKNEVDHGITCAVFCKYWSTRHTLIITTYWKI